MLGASSFIIWGIVPLFYRELFHAGPLEIIAHRIVWTLALTVTVLALTRKITATIAFLRTPRSALLLTAAGLLVVINWTVYVFAVATDRVLDASLGYFINPLITVILAVTVLRERLRPGQWIALSIGASAVVVMALGHGGLPWISLTLAGSFGAYGLVKKAVGASVPALSGLAIETLIMSPVALGYLIFLGTSGQSSFTGNGPLHTGLLVATGAVTAVPLLAFAAAARRIKLSTLGILQYMGPMLQFILGITIFRETMPASRWAGFGIIWLALIVLSIDAWRASAASRIHRKNSAAAASEGGPGSEKA